MRFLLLSDIHGNAIALKEILKQLHYPKVRFYMYHTI